MVQIFMDQTLGSKVASILLFWPFQKNGLCKHILKYSKIELFLGWHGSIKLKKVWETYCFCSLSLCVKLMMGCHKPIETFYNGKELTWLPQKHNIYIYIRTVSSWLLLCIMYSFSFCLVCGRIQLYTVLAALPKHAIN